MIISMPAHVCSPQPQDYQNISKTLNVLGNILGYMWWTTAKLQKTRFMSSANQTQTLNCPESFALTYSITSVKCWCQKIQIHPSTHVVRKREQSTTLASECIHETLRREGCQRVTETVSFHSVCTAVPRQEWKWIRVCVCVCCQFSLRCLFCKKHGHFHSLFSWHVTSHSHPCPVTSHLVCESTWCLTEHLTGPSVRRGRAWVTIGRGRTTDTQPTQQREYLILIWQLKFSSQMAVIVFLQWRGSPEIFYIWSVGTKTFWIVNRGLNKTFPSTL